MMVLVGLPLVALAIVVFAYIDTVHERMRMRARLDEQSNCVKHLQEQSRALTLLKIRYALVYKTLDAIATQNAGQPTFEVWAKKMASDALLRTSSKNEGMNPKGPRYM